MDELILKEGEEDVQYILVDIPDDAPVTLEVPGTVLQLQGLDTAEPLLLDANGKVLMRGRHQDTLGSILVLAPGGRSSELVGGSDEQQDPGHEAAAAAAAGAAAAAAASSQEGGEGEAMEEGRQSSEHHQQQQPQQQQQQQAPPQQPPKPTQYLCHLEKRLVFSSVDLDPKGK